MKKKILIISVFATLLILSMTMISSIQAQTTSTKPMEKMNGGCSICHLKTSNGRPLCDFIFNRIDGLEWIWDNYPVIVNYKYPKLGELLIKLATGWTILALVFDCI
ncbi:MAG: hypothetical protein JSW62_06155 [Thermoplasmatales archaeon]|nr:MAG: hypothetical protein JSW62_06155 [Thermoplasmatales archaeon]